MRIAILFLLMYSGFLVKAQKLDKSIHVSYLNVLAQNEEINKSYGMGFSVSAQFMYSLNQRIDLGTEINYQYVTLNFIDYVETLCLHCDRFYSGSLKLHELRVPLLVRWNMTSDYSVQLGAGVSTTFAAQAKIDHYFRLSGSAHKITEVKNGNNKVSQFINPFFTAAVGRQFIVKNRQLFAALKYNYNVSEYPLFFEHPEDVDQEYFINFHQAAFSFGIKI